MREQDAYCSKAAAGQFNNLGNFPDDLRWEALVDVLRGKVKVSYFIIPVLSAALRHTQVHIHCYEAVDLDDMVGVSHNCGKPSGVTCITNKSLKLSNEFQFPIAAFHHASEAYLVPELLKKVYGELFV